MQAQLTDARLSLYRPDVILRPQPDGVELASFRRLADAVRAGEEAALADLDRLRALAGPIGPHAGADMLPREEGDA